MSQKQWGHGFHAGADAATDQVIAWKDGELLPAMAALQRVNTLLFALESTQERVSRFEVARMIGETIAPFVLDAWVVERGADEVAP